MPPGGRPRLIEPNLPTGLFRVGGRFHWRATSVATNKVLQALAPGKKSIAVRTEDAEAARLWWVKTVLPVLDLVAPADDRAGRVAEVLDRYELEEVPTFRSESGRSGAKRYVAELRKNFGSRTYARNEGESGLDRGHLSAVDVTKYLYANKHRPVIANRCVRALNKAFVLARRRWGLTTYNPAAQAEYHTEAPRDVYIDDATFLRIRGCGKPVLQCMMDIAQMVGARRGMIIDIRVGEIDRQAGLLWLRPNKQRTAKKAKPFAVRITAELDAVLRRAEALRAKCRGGARLDALPTAYLFITRNGTPYGKQSFARLWTTARRRAGLKAGEVTFHDIRAKTGSDSESDEAAQKRLQHKDLSTTRSVYRRKQSIVEPLPPVAFEKN